MEQKVTLFNYRDKELKANLRDRALKIIRARGIGPGRVVNEAGMNHATLRTFLNDTKDIAFVQMCKVENWVLEHEIDEDCDGKE